MKSFSRSLRLYSVYRYAGRFLFLYRRAKKGKLSERQAKTSKKLQYLSQTLQTPAKYLLLLPFVHRLLSLGLLLHTSSTCSKLRYPWFQHLLYTIERSACSSAAYLFCFVPLDQIRSDQIRSDHTLLVEFSLDLDQLATHLITCRFYQLKPRLQWLVLENGLMISTVSGVGQNWCKFE